MRHGLTFFTLYLALLPIVGYATAAGSGVGERWLAYYSDKASPADFRAYDLLVLDSDHRPALAPLAEHGKTLLGYLSLGEAEQYRHHFAAVRGQGLLLGENPNWKGSYFLDIRQRAWTERVIYELIPFLLHQGFDGVFLDTLDGPLHLERKDPERYRGMGEAAIRLVRTIRRQFPHIRIMLNRAYEILPEVAGDIDIVLGESVYADYDFGSESYKRVPQQLYQAQLAYLKQAQRINPRLKVFTLDYWEPDDERGIAEIYRAQRANGFVPYVATVALDRIVSEPRI
ncbi:MAG TPA: hypothetical protein ENJ43_02310 [Gammaproteobacteria bacterium]|nr:hypothetical protein [Gammaproteobacteria bacterium]